MNSINSVERFFPLRDISDVLRLFKFQLEQCREPDLALLSIVAGIIESGLTNGRLIIDNDQENDNENRLPTVEYRVVYALHSKFRAIIKGYVDLSLFGNIKYASRELVKKVSDVIWNCLSRNYYKDRPHIQSLYSFLTGSRLDCFGVALAVVASCQLLGFKDVHLAVSEDHTWVMFGANGSETAEVTWHGKGNDDKRGQDISSGLTSRCWLYLSGHPVICDRQLEVAALVSSINNSMSTHADSVQLSNLQQELLWLLYDKGLLSRYPMAIGNLGDLEEINPTSGRPLCSTLFNEAVMVARVYYNNMHVYPYAYQGGFFYRHNMYKEAFESWANASDVLRQYNYTRDDEEIYREVMEIANELIPHVMKTVSSGHSAHSILKDPDCFAYLLRFYDGICQWEEGSLTPVLHIGWVKPLVNTISKFDAEVRGKVIILEEDSIENSDENSNIKPAVNKEVESARTREDDASSSKKKSSDEAGDVKDVKIERTEEIDHNSTNTATTDELVHPDIKALTAACSEKILNRDFLIQGDGNPFLGNGDGAVSGGNASSSSSTLVTDEENHSGSVDVVGVGSSPGDGRPRIILYSEKMRGLKNLLLIEKLNTHAISLQLTAQSQVQIGGKRSAATTAASKDDDSATTSAAASFTSSRPKRSRRE